MGGETRGVREKRIGRRDGLKVKSGEIKSILCATHLHTNLCLSCTV